MELYDFEVLRGEEIIAAERAVPLLGPEATWPKIMKLAKSVKPTGCRIRVKEQGETIILIGAAAALRYSILDRLATRGVEMAADARLIDRNG
jgi:hypothetical protein